MILFNTLVRTDLVLLVIVILLFIVQVDFWKGFLQGAGGVLFLISAGLHIQHYKLTKKLY